MTTQVSLISRVWAAAQKSGDGDRLGLAVRGSAWSTIGYVATQVLRTLATLILARRFLGPEAFGIVGLVGVFLSGLAMFSELGLAANIVQHPRGDEQDFLDTAFSVQSGRGLAIWLVAIAAAYPLAQFYGQMELFPLVVVAGASEFVRGLSSTAAWTLTRHVQLRSITLLNVAAEAVSFCVGIVWAVMSPSAWVLVGRTIITAVVYSAGSHFITGRRVRFRWDSTAARDILHFGGWISISTAAYFLGGQGERLILGKFVTAAELGCFSLALMIASVPAGGINQLVNQIFLPMISSSVRKGGTAVHEDFARSRKLFMGLAIFAAMGFLICAGPVVNVALSEKYKMTVWLLQLLGLRVALDLFAAPASSLVLAYGQSRYSAAANAVRVVGMLAGIFISVRFLSFPYAVASLVIAQAISYLPLIWGIKTLLPGALRREVMYYAVLLVLVFGCGAISLLGLHA